MIFCLADQVPRDTYVLKDWAGWRQKSIRKERFQSAPRAGTASFVCAFNHLQEILLFTKVSGIPLLIRLCWILQAIFGLSIFRLNVVVVNFHFLADFSDCLASVMKIKFFQIINSNSFFVVEMRTPPPKMHNVILERPLIL